MNALCNKLIDIRDMEKAEWHEVLEQMHCLMRVPKGKRTSFRHCTDRKSLFHRAEIETYKHWEYPWAVFWGSFEPGVSVLDCGCGRGFLQIYLALKGCRVVSVDISTMKTKRLRRFWDLSARLGLPVREDTTSAVRNLARRYGAAVDFRVANISDLPFEEERFDRVCCISVLEHMAPGQDQQAMREMSRVLKPGGRLLATVDFSPTPLSARTYDEKEIRRLIDVSGLRPFGDCDYSVDDWDGHLDGLRQCFERPNALLSSAAIHLIKDKGA